MKEITNVSNSKLLVSHLPVIFFQFKQDVKELKDSMKEAISTLKSRMISSHNFCVVDGQKNVQTCDLNHFSLPATQTLYHPCPPPPVEKQNDQPFNSYTSSVMPSIPYSSPLSHFTYPSSADLQDNTDDYVLPLPPPITTPLNFSPIESSHDEDSTIELTSSSDGSTRVNISRSPIKQINSKKLLCSGEKQSMMMEGKIYPITEVFNPLFLDARKKESVSRPNFATILVQNFFKKEVRITSNVAGKCGKNQLSRDMMAAIKVAIFRMWPLAVSEDQQTAWRICTKAIDEAGRRLYRSRSPFIKENLKKT